MTLAEVADRAETVVPHEGTWIEILAEIMYQIELAVVPHEGTWIEIRLVVSFRTSPIVVPHEGTWIEIIEE